LVDSTRLAAELDPEDWRDAVRAYQDAATAVVERYEGHIAQFLGDGLLIYFGYPKAHEDDAERALLSALGIVRALDSVNAKLRKTSGITLAVRAGVHTGPVVVGEMGGGARRETLALGSTTNVAARLQGAAEPNAVVASEKTRRLVVGQFVTEDLGALQLKGLAEPVSAHLVLHEAGVRSRLDVARPLTPMVGRTRELGLLLDRWARAQGGTGQAVLVSGEAGVGKSRLVRELRDELATERHTWLECRCSPYTANSAFAPIVEVVRQGLGFAAGDSDDEKLAKLAARIAPAGTDGLDDKHAVTILARFLDLPVAADAGPELTPAEQREQAMTILTRWAFGMSVQQPVLMLVEDLHWCDPSSLEFFERLIDEIPGARMCVVMTARPEFAVPWHRGGGKPAPSYTPMSLAALTNSQASQMLEQLVAANRLTEGARAQIVARADGVPLYVEELARMVLDRCEGILADEAASQAETEGAIPETLEASLTARLDRLDGGKHIAQTASVLGREFPYALLERVAGIDERTLREGLGRLVDAGMIFRGGESGNRHYTFKHALIQDAAYASLLKSARREYHLRTAQALAGELVGIAEGRPELVARHYHEGGAWEDAVAGWLDAGARAVKRSANLEAISYLEAGLAAVGKLDDSPVRTQRELELHVTIGPPLMATRGYADPDVERGYRRALELCQALGEPPAVFPVMFGLWTYHCLRAMHVPGRRLAEDLTQAAERTGDTGLLLEADLAMGANLFYVGALTESRSRCERGIAAYDETRDAEHAFAYGQDPRVALHCYLALDQWLMGDSEAALATSERSIELARELEHPFTLAYALTFAAWYQRLRGTDFDRCREIIAELHEVAGKQGIVPYHAFCTAVLGSIMIESGEESAGLETLQTGLESYGNTGTSVLMPYLHGLLGDGFRRVGRIADAAGAIAHGFDVLEKNNETWCEAELLRYRAMVRAAGGDDAGVEADCERAMTVAQEQGAKAWRARAAVGLFGHLKMDGRDDEAYALLETVRAELDPSRASVEATELDALLSQAH
jgi:class 3 adenylate cyclase/tetratricopeptide (TPR) repeat protein